MNGKKTYLVMIVAIVVNGLFATGYIGQEHLPTVNAILGFLGLGAVRHGIKTSK